MNERIDEIVAATIHYTDEILKEDPTCWPVARRGIETMIANLAEGAPDHPALGRLRIYCEREQAHYDANSGPPKA
jgi:hypothetical protein